MCHREEERPGVVPPLAEIKHLCLSGLAAATPALLVRQAPRPPRATPCYARQERSAQGIQLIAAAQEKPGLRRA
jgi:hypothetical protein